MCKVQATKNVNLTRDNGDSGYKKKNIYLCEDSCNQEQEELTDGTQWISKRAFSTRKKRTRHMTITVHSYTQVPRSAKLLSG